MLTAVCSAAVLTSVIPAGHVLAATSSQTAVTTDALNVRSGAGMLYGILTTLPTGTAVTVLDDSQDDWVKVRTSDGTEGYCSREYLTLHVDSQEGSSENDSFLRLDTKTYTNTEGQVYQFLAKVNGGSGTLPTVTSTDPSVASVQYVRTDSRGYLYQIDTLAEGKTTIVVTADGVTATLPVTVTAGTSGQSSSSASSGSGQSPTGAVKLDTREYSNTSGQIYQFLAKVASGDMPTVTSSDPSVAAVKYVRTDSRGHLYQIDTLAPGETTISVTADGETATLPVTVTGGEAVSGDAASSSSNVGVSLDTKAYANSVGNIYQFLATITGDFEDMPTVTSSNPSVVSVEYVRTDSRGHLYQINTLAEGKANITVTAGDVSRSFPVTVQGEGEGAAGEVLDPVTQKAVQSITVKERLNLRTGPNTSYTRIAILDAGDELTPMDLSHEGWAQVQTADGTVGYVSTDYVTYQFTDGTTNESQGGTVNSIYPYEDCVIAQGKTMYTKAAFSSGATVTWSSSDTSVATVYKGYIYGVSPGTAVITVSSGGQSASCTVTVTAAEPVKFVYVDPNTVSVGEQANVVAITDNTRSSVQFQVETEDGTTETYTTDQYASENVSDDTYGDNNTRVWTVPVTFTEPGQYKVTAYSSTGSTYSSLGKSTTIYVVSSDSDTESTYDQRRISDDMLNLIAKWEGYSATIYDDTLTSSPTPTLGYGKTYKEGSVFYNNLTKREAWALLCNTINDMSYTSEVNAFLQKNNIKANQQQFDAMVSFSYNVGAGYWNGTSTFDLRTVMLNAVVPPTIAAGSSLPAKTTASAFLYTEKDRDSTKLKEVASGTALSVTEATYDSQTRSSWYKVQLSDGSTGWMSGGNIAFDNADSMVRDLNYADAGEIGYRFLEWHQAGGRCLPGLVYRRLGEAKVFSFGDYASADPSSSNYRVNLYDFVYPSCVQQYEVN